MRHVVVFVFLLLVAACMPFSFAQRRVTPVEASDELKIVTKEELKALRERAKAEQFYADSLLQDSLRRDSVSKANKVVRPLLMSAAVGLNVWDPLMRAFGQSYGGGEVWFALNLKNRFIPVVELGLGSANSTPEESNYTYKGKTAFYGKIGMNYNFMASKDPKYQFYAGVRAGWSAFKYDVKDVAIDNSYWDGNVHSLDITGQSSSATWGEFVLGLQVELFKNFSMGWSFRYHFLFKIKDNLNSRPWYIPGYGSRDNPIGASLSLVYTLPLSRQPEVRNVMEQNPETVAPAPEMPLPSDSISVPERGDRVREPISALDDPERKKEAENE